MLWPKGKREREKKKREEKKERKGGGGRTITYEAESKKKWGRGGCLVGEK